MDHLVNGNSDSIDMESVADSALEEVEAGKIISGTVVRTDRDYVYVNVGMKSDGRVPVSEFDPLPMPGEAIDLILKSRKFVDGMYECSARAAERGKKWKAFIEWYRAGNRVITGRIKSSSNSGKMVTCMGMQAFLPFSLVGDLKAVVSDENEYEFLVKSVDEKKNSFVISRRDYIDEQRKKTWETFIASHKTGDTVTGEVMRFVEFGAFVRIDGVDALLHRNDMSWKKVFKQRKIFKQGDVRQFIILDIKTEEGKVSLGFKQLYEDPWLTAGDRYIEGAIVEGEVVTMTRFGAFVELEEGIEGFVPGGELSWIKTGVKPEEIFEKGERYKFYVTGINGEEKRISLSYKKQFGNPWETLKERYRAGTVLTGKITRVARFGLFVEIEEGIDGLVHVSDLSWDDQPSEALNKYKAGENLEIKILEVKPSEMKISCGVKQLQRSPWELIREKYPVRSRVEGVVSSITAFGVFVKLEENVEGLVHISEVSNTRVENLEDRFKPGDRVSAVVLDIDVSKKRLSLSIKHYEKISEKEEFDKIMKGTKPSAVTLGDMIDLKWDK
jgi:small subunit ribosomal protein S1